MPEEFVCEECAYTSIEDGNCPFCGNRMIKIDDELDKDLAEAGDERYSSTVKNDNDDLELDNLKKTDGRTEEDDFDVAPNKKTA